MREPGRTDDALLGRPRSPATRSLGFAPALDSAFLLVATSHHMPFVPGLRSPYAKVGRLVYFGRMLDKIRLHAAGRLPADYIENLGDKNPGVFDTRCCRFVRASY